MGGAIIAVAGTAITAQSDATGHYQLSGIANVPFSLNITASGYQSLTFTNPSTAHGSFTMNVAMTRLAGGSFALEGLTISSPEIDPYTEVGVLGTVRNTGTSEAGLIFNAIIYNTQQQVVRDVPAVVVGAHMQPSEAILPMAAGATRAVTIAWGIQSDPPGTYQVRFRGLTPSGQVAVEGNTNYSVRAVRRLGGGIDADPPLLQAGLGQSVAVTAKLGSLGNLQIGAGSVELTATLVRADTRPPFPTVPEVGAPVVQGAPLAQPVDATSDSAGNVYVVNRFNRELIRIAPGGSTSTLRALSGFFNGTTTGMGEPRKLAMHPDGRLRVLWTGDYISAIELTPPYSQTDSTPNLGGGVSAYDIDNQGNEYFAGFIAGKYQLIKRSSAGNVSTLAESSFNRVAQAAVGANQNVFVADESGIFSVDPSTGRTTRLLGGMQPSGILALSNGDLLIAEKSLNRIRRFSNGTLTTFASLPSPERLSLGLDGNVYVLQSAASRISRVDTNGAVAVFASALIDSPTALSFDDQQRLLALNAKELRRRNADGSIHTLATGFSAGAALAPAADGTIFVGDIGSVKRVTSQGVETLASLTGSSVRALTVSASGEAVVAHSGSRSEGLLRLNGGNFASIIEIPSALNDLGFVDGRPVLNDGDQLFEIGNRLTLLGSSYGTSGELLGSSRNDLYLRVVSGSAGQTGLFKVSADGSRALMSTNTTNWYGRAAIDNNEHAIFGRTDRGVYRLNLATNESQLLVTMPGAEFPWRIAVDDTNRVFVESNSQKLYRIDGASLVLIEGGAQGLISRPGAKPWWRSTLQLRTLGANDAIENVGALETHADLWAPSHDGKLAQITGTRRFRLREPSGAATYDLPLPGNIVSVATLAQDSVVADVQGRIHRIAADGSITRVGPDTYTRARKVSVNQGRLFALHSDGVYEITNGSPVFRWSQSSWGNDHRLFDVSGQLIAASDSFTGEIIVSNDNHVVASLVPLSIMTMFAPQSDGRWLAASSNRLVQIAADGLSSRVIYSSSSISLADLQRTPTGDVLALDSGLSLYRVSSDLNFVAIATRPETFGLNFPCLAIGPEGSTYVAGSGGQVLQREGQYLRRRAGGMVSVSDIDVDSGGLVYLTDSTSGSLGVIDEIGYRRLASGFSAPFSLTLHSDSEILIGTDQDIVVSDAEGRWSRRLLTTQMRGVARSGSLSALAIDAANRAIPIALGQPSLPVPEGTVVYRRTLPHGPYGASNTELIDFGSFVPPVGGDYEITARSTQTDVIGQATTGLHVGPNTVAHMNAEPSRTVPGDRTVRVGTQIEGGDFSSISRVDISLLQLAIPESINPLALGADASGALWFQSTSGLCRVPPGSTASTTVVPGQTLNRGEVPVDSQQRIYFAKRGTQVATTQIMRVNTDLSNEPFVTVTGTVVSMTIDPLDQLFVLLDGKIQRIAANGSISDFMTIPAGTPFGITRDGAGNFYVLMRQNIIYKIDPLRNLTTIVSDATFEYENFNIAGTCAEGLFFTPFTYNRLGQSGEEYTIAQVLSSGEIGAVFNGYAVSEKLTDIDLITYDRFRSRLLMFTHDAVTFRTFSIPVTCGAIDVALHVVLPAGQAYSNASPAPTQTIELSNGDKELVFELRDVNRQGVSIDFDTVLSNLMRGESRAVAKAATLVFRNTFIAEPVRLTVQVPRVDVEDLIDIEVSTDRTAYPQNTAVNIDLWLRNEQSLAASGRLVVSVVDAGGALVERLIDRTEQLDASEARELDPPFTTGSRRAGEYRVLAQMFADDGVLVAEHSSAFAITAGAGTPALTSTVATDRTQYVPTATALIAAQLTNPNTNQAFKNLTVRETVLKPDGSTLQVLTRAVPNLEPNTDVRLDFELPLSNAATGRYEVRQQVLDSAGSVLSAPTTSFDVIAQQGNDALSGSLAVAPQSVPRPQPTQLTATVRNRGSAALSEVPLALQILNPSQGNALLREFSFTRNIATNETIALEQSWSTEGIAPGPYIVLLVSKLGGETRVLDQKPLTVLALIVNGTVSATPTQATQTQAIALNATARNVGNLAGTDLPFVMRLIRNASGNVAREFAYTSSLPVNGELTRSESLAAGSLPLGEYRVEWSLAVAGTTQPLAQAELRIVGAQIGGTLEASPASLQLGEVVQLNGTVRNTGNTASGAIPVRLEVRRQDTQVVQQSWNDSATITANGIFVIQRQWTANNAARYDGVLQAQLDGTWQTLSTATFYVLAPAVDVQLRMAVQRDARLLVLVSCDPGQSQNGSIGSNPALTETICESNKKMFLEQYLTQIAVEHTVVTTAEAFLRELRCGRYNVYWLSGGSEKLSVSASKELRETIYRGEGLILDGSHDQRTALLDTIAGFNFRGRHAQENQVLRGSGTLLPAADVTTYGRALNLELSSGQLQATFVATASPAAISHSFGQGRTMTYAFDLVEALRRDTTQPATTRLLDAALFHVAPTVVTADHPANGYVPVTTTIENRAASVNLNLRTDVSTPGSVASSAPAPTSSDPQSATWEFGLATGQTRSFDVAARLPSAADTTVRSTLQRRNGALLEPLSNQSAALPLRQVSATAQSLIDGLNAANLSGGESQARNRAVTAIQAALAAHQSGDSLSAIARWIDAAEDIVRIGSMPHAEWRLANTRLLEVSQRAACSAVAPSCNVLGAAGDYNGFFFDSYTALSSDVQGRLAAGGNVSLNNYSIADQLPTDFSGTSLLVGGNLIFPSGRVYRGDIVIGGSGAGVGAPVINGLGPNQRLIQNAPMPIDFAAERTRLIAESQRLRTFPTNTTHEYQWGGLYLHGDNTSPVQVFNLNGQQVLDAHTFQVDRIPAGATVLFNVSGTNTGLTNMSLSSLIAHRNKVLFNFYEATSLQLAGISVEGSILAPMANLDNPQGVIWGTIVANRWNGQMQINLAAHSGCMVAPVAPPNLCASTPTTPVKVATGQGTFGAFESRERLEVRGGRTGTADWEWGLGSNTQSAGQFVSEHLNWIHGKDYRFVLRYDGQGSGSYQVLDGSNLLFTKTFNAGPGRQLRTGNALELFAKTNAGQGSARVVTTLNRLENGSYSETLQTAGDNNYSEVRSIYFSPALVDGFELEGTIRLEFTGTAPPTGSRLNFFVTAGNLTCGAAP